MSVSATAWQGNDTGGRPHSLRRRRKDLTLAYIKAVGADRLTPLITENIQRAVELTIMAQATRDRVSPESTAAELLAVIGLEDAVDKAIDRLALQARAVGSPDRAADASASVLA